MSAAHALTHERGFTLRDMIGFMVTPFVTGIPSGTPTTPELAAGQRRHKGPERSLRQNRTTQESAT